jgi:hypothetical protein
VLVPRPSRAWIHRHFQQRNKTIKNNGLAELMAWTGAKRAGFLAAMKAQ